MKGLTCAGINSDLNKRCNMALYFLKTSSKFDTSVRKWENKPPAQETWANIKTFILTKYAHKNKQNKLITKQFKANILEEQAEATGELIATLTENHTHQMETLMKSTTDAMKEMMSLIKSKSKAPNKTTNNEKKKKCKEKHKKYNGAPICKHCGRKHPSKPENECWELEKNQVFHPANWKNHLKLHGAHASRNMDAGED
jgi:hypothetical protein